MNQDSRNGEKLRAEYQTESVMPDLSKTGEFTRFTDESRKTIQELVKIELLSWEKFPRTYSAAIQHLRNMFNAFKGAEAQDQE